MRGFLLQVSVILGHPGHGSFNHAIANTVIQALKKSGHAVCFHDLYAEKFDPLLLAGEIPSDALADPVIIEYCKEIAHADGIVIIHPNWWGQPPAIVKGWIDRVIRPGIAYEFLEGDRGEGVPVGLLKANIALVFNTSNTTEEREKQVFGDPLEALWKTCIFKFCGVKDFYRKMFCVMVTSTPEQRQLWLQEVEIIVDRYFPS